MYAWIFRHLPGPVWLRVLIGALLILAAVWVLFELVFPWLVAYSPWATDGTVVPPH